MDGISEEYGVDRAAAGLDRSEPVVSVRGLVKRYGRREAVAGIDFEVRRGEIFAFLGPNGPLTEAGPGGSTVVHSQSPLVHLQMLGDWALGRGFDLPDLDVHRPALEEVYLSLTGPASTKDQQ